MATSVSIIIPVFNAQATIGETLKSIQAEIVRSPEISCEVIAVDDGSTDGSAEVLKFWEGQIPIKTFSMNHTGSPASPRNFGIQQATSKFVFFLDSDDVLISGGLQTAVEFAIENGSDVVLPRLVSLDGRGVPRGMYSKNKPDVNLENSRIYWALNPMKLIRRSLLVENEITFDTSLSRDEDQPFAFKVYLAANKISILADPPVVGVRYSPSGTNLTMRDYSKEELLKYLSVMTQIMDEGVDSMSTRQFLLIRNWEIEVSREFVWKRLALMPKESWASSFEDLHEFSKERLVPSMLPRTSIRWRGIVGLIGAANYDELQKLLLGRKLVLENRSWLSKVRGVFISNLIRLKSTIFLPKNF
jgi:glycosyltransferase involved in cell wall biosynthesis